MPAQTGMLRAVVHVGMQAVAGREAALQQVEEARLALRAAERDNADLHARLQQAAASSRHSHRQQHEPTARQLWAGLRGRSTAHGSLAASPVSRYQAVPLPVKPA